MRSFKDILLQFIAGIAFIATFSVLVGYIFTILWSWFIPVTFGIPTPPLPIAIGMILMVQLVRLKIHPQFDWDPDALEPEWKYVYFQLFSLSFAILAIGWGVKQFI